MTVSSSLSTQTFNCDGSTTVFTCPFRVLEASELVGYLITVATNESTPLVNGTDFSVSGAGSSNAVATTTATYSSAYQINFRRRTQLLQLVDYRDNDPFPAESHETALDRLTHMTQESATDIGRALLAPEPESGITLPSAASRANLLLGFNSSGAPVAVAPADGSAAALALDLASTYSPTKGSGQLGRGYGLAYGASTVGAALSHYINAMEKGAVADRATNNTAAVQAALNALGVSGGTVEVPPGARFNLQALTFPQRSNIDYWMDDDLSRPNPSTTLGTNERVLFQANANAGGIVNEHRVTAAFHPSLNIDVRRDVAGHDAHLGAGQVRVPTSSTPARASWNIFDQQVDAFRTAYQIFGGDYSLFSGVTSHGWRRTVTITGVGTGAGGFVSAPAVGTEVTGTVSGAKGWFLSATATTTTLLWNSGKFAAGDRLIDNNETTANAASSMAFAIEPTQPFGQDLRRGNWSFGLPVGVGTDLLSVGGRVALLPTRTFSQYVDKAITHPGLVLSDLVSDVPTNGFVIHYDTTAAAASRRLTVRRISGAAEDTTDSAHVNACRAHCNFGNAGSVSASAFNVASVTRTGTGRYDIVFTRAMERADYSVSINLEEGSTKGGYPLSKTVNGFTLAIATIGGTTAVDLAAAASVVVFGGDI